MEFRLDVDRLTKDELEYELAVRGIEDSGSVDKLRKSLRGVLMLERSGVAVSSFIQLDAKKELTVCDQKIVEIRDILGAFTATASQIKKIEGKFAHVFARIDRIATEDDELIEKRKHTLGSLVDLVSEYSIKNPGTGKPEPSIAPAFPQFHTDESSGTSSGNSQAVVHPNQAVAATVVTNTVPVYKWNLTFSGTPGDGLSFNAFLERVEDLRLSRNVSKTQLFESAIDLFKGEALLWFRMVRREVNDWDSLVNLMRQEFMPSYTADILWNQILRRTQGPGESIGIYVAAMSHLFDRMPVSVPDELRLQVLRSNILPFYQERLVLIEIKTPYELIEYCRKLETAKVKINEYKPPIGGQLTLEPDLDYCHPAGQSSSLHVREFTVTEPKLPLCFRCNKPGHFARNCRVRTQLKCFGCGKLNCTKNTCSECNKKSGNGDRRQR